MRFPGIFSNLTTPVTDGEFSGLCGDQTFIEKNNLVMNDVKVIENNTFTESDGVYGGTFLYKALSDDYIKNVTIGANVLNCIE